MCKFYDPSIICSRDIEGGGSEEPPPPPQSQIDQKKPSLNRVQIAESLRSKGQMNQNFDIRSLASLKQLNTKTYYYKVYSPKNFAS